MQMRKLFQYRKRYGAACNNQQVTVTDTKLASFNTVNGSHAH